MKKILIVEDNTQINNLVCEYLKKKSFECVQAFSGTEALLYLKNQPFDVIILDLMLMCGKVSQEFDWQQPCYSVKIKGNYIENRWKT